MARAKKASGPSLAELRQRHVVEELPLPADVLAALEADPRAGAKSLLRAIEARARANRAEGQRLRHMLKFETELWEQGYVHIAGVDEAGVGPLAGPVVAGAAILPRGYKLKGLDDSKKILDEGHREELAAAIKRDALAWATGWCTPAEIDTHNIYQASLLAMRRAVEGLAIVPHYLLVDARTVPGVPMPQRGIVKGDAQSLSIAAGAMLAKTSRDAHMIELDAKHPGYGFAVHKGYPTPTHLEALKKLGVLPFHRRSFAPVREALGQVPSQRQLF
jgi:ribonuclease HII